MEYRKTIPFDGDGAKAIEMVRAVFICNNFKIESFDRTRIVAVGPGMQNTKQNSLLGATRIRILATPSAIELSAELGGVKRMRYFLYGFPPSLALFMSIIFFIVRMPVFAAAIPWLAVSPWLICSPLIVKWIENRTISALDTLLHNMKTSCSTAEIIPFSA